MTADVERDSAPRMETVTLIIPMLNEARYIRACLESIAAQTHPQEHLEVLVYDGGSTDESLEVVNELAEHHSWITLLDNPRRIQAAAWNLGIDRARGDVIGIVSAHAELDPTYVSAALETLQRTGADMVGGPTRSDAEGAFGQAVALANASRFGVGGSISHYADVEQEVDTVFMGVCPAAVYRSLRFDEEMVRNQDDEFSYRLLDQGGRIVCNPAIVSRYHNRATWAGLARQYYAYGFWKVRVIQKHPRQVRARHLIPAAFVGTLVGSALLAPFAPVGQFGLVAGLGTYAVANAAAAVRAARGFGPSVIAGVAISFATMHGAYGAGMWAGVGRLLVRRMSSRSDATSPA